MMALETALSFAWRHWRAFLGVGLAIAALAYIGVLKGELSHWHKTALQFAEQNRMLEATYTAAQQTARANNLEAVRKAEADTTKISEDKQHEIEAQLAGARALADAYLKRLRSAPSNDQGHSGQASLSEAAGAPGDPVGTNRVPIVDAGDVQVCTKNTVVALGYQRFYGEVRARYDALTQ